VSSQPTAQLTQGHVGRPFRRISRSGKTTENHYDLSPRGTRLLSVMTIRSIVCQSGPLLHDFVQVLQLFVHLPIRVAGL
jgi:hypothetical protein